MAKRIVDLSMPLENEVKSDPENVQAAHRVFRPQGTFDQLSAFFPGLKPEDMPDGEAWALERINLTTHNGTHLDEPFHFHSTMDGGKRALIIDEIDLDWCFQPGVKLDFRHLPDGHDRTFGQMSSEEKHGLPPRGQGLSHRARAFMKFAEACLGRR